MIWFLIVESRKTAPPLSFVTFCKIFFLSFLGYVHIYIQLLLLWLDPNIPKLESTAINIKLARFKLDVIYSIKMWFTWYYCLILFENSLKLSVVAIKNLIQDYCELGHIWYWSYLHFCYFSCCYHKLPSSHHLLLGAHTQVEYCSYIINCLYFIKFNYS